MMSRLLADIAATFANDPFCVETQVVESREFSRTQFVVRFRATLADGRTLLLRYYVNGTHIDYSYQVMHGDLVTCRWDNKEHFPDLASHPHHFHVPNGTVTDSPLRGNCAADLRTVLGQINRTKKPWSTKGHRNA